MEKEQQGSPPSPDPLPLKQDPDRARYPDRFRPTGYPVRALISDGTREVWGNVDIMHLTRDSLLQWLRSRPNLAENVVLSLLRHEAP